MHLLCCVSKFIEAEDERGTDRCVEYPSAYLRNWKLIRWTQRIAVLLERRDDGAPGIGPPQMLACNSTECVSKTRGSARLSFVVFQVTNISSPLLPLGYETLGL